MRAAWNVLAIAGLALALSACGEQSQERAVERAVERESGGKVKADFSQGKVQIKGEEGETTISTGGTVALPDTFPKDVMVYKGAKVLAATSHPKATSVHLEVADDAKTVVAAYTADMKAKGWEEEMVTTMPQGTVCAFKKGKRHTSVTVAATSGKTTVHIVTMQEDE